MDYTMLVPTVRLVLCVARNNFHLLLTVNYVSAYDCGPQYSNNMDTLDAAK
jgi:hypothetical protein